jgi:LmbE family N-acetylglucosaminyl deacetylase
MTPMPDDLRGRSLLAVFAHPDDESLACGGLLAWCAQLGARVSLLCVTHGEDGEHGPESGSQPVLGEIRAQELQAAARVLGISDLIVLDYPDGMLPWVDPAALVADIRDTIRRIRPDVVITFGEDGLYWHPDHIAIHERTTAAVAALAAIDAVNPVNPVNPANPVNNAVPALYYVTMPPGSMRAVVDHAEATVPRQAPGGRPPRLILGIENADAFGALALAPTLVVDASQFAARKLAAIKCHRTQLGDSALNLLAESDAPRLLGTEYFRRSEVGSAADAFIERFASGV